ncbi:MAG: ABC transporter substrate-binding protein [Streptomycetaceae bacterium]|nr:ABC transporter substrate-binding protein [Streptomycetaceae bacterium]
MPRLLTALAAVLALAATACGTSGTTAGGSGPGRRLTIALETEPDCLDPQVSAFDVTAAVGRNVYDSLVYQAEDGSLHPWLATAWDVSPDGLAYTFTLASGIVFHDGTPFTAEAVKATLDHTVAPATKSQYAAGLLTAYAGTDILDERTVRVRLKEPFVPLLQVLSTATLGIQSPTQLRDNAGKLCQAPVGTGPFTFRSWTRNREIVLDRNPAYQWGPPGAAHTGPARLAGLVIKTIPEAAVRYGSLTSGQIDILGTLPAAHVGDLKHSDDFRFLSYPQPGAVFSLFLNPYRAPFDDERVRTAFQRALRLDQLVDAIYSGRYQRAWNVLSPTTPGYSPALENTWPYDPDYAARLLDEAGWTERDADGYRTKDGKRLTVHWPYTAKFLRDQRDILGQGIQAEAKRAGIDLRFEAQDPGTYVKNALSKNADILAFSWTRAEPDILRSYFASDQTAQKGGSNTFGYNVPELDAWTHEAAANPDPAVRAADYDRVQRYVVEHAFVVPIYVPTYLAGTSDDVDGLVFDAQAYLRFYDASFKGAP